MSEISAQLPDSPSRKKSGRGWNLLMVLPYLGLCFPRFYTRATPALWGFPFFYWYQFAWVLTTSALLTIVYLKISRPAA
jgi:hypothetical protein